MAPLQTTAVSKRQLSKGHKGGTSKGKAWLIQAFRKARRRLRDKEVNKKLDKSHDQGADNESQHDEEQESNTEDPNSGSMSNIEVGDGKASLLGINQRSRVPSHNRPLGISVWHHDHPIPHQYRRPRPPAQPDLTDPAEIAAAGIRMYDDPPCTPFTTPQ
uniref:Uncharacterized protein n=1 Tax=Mycena chlorophos TaxID=658473 RepID=A0ABQ0LMI4_MYCCL|nr:predicted protein [Mycena chlorophos]